MNSLNTLTNEYIRSDKSIDTIVVSNENSNKTFYIYNYQGCSFRVFDSLLKLIDFFQGKHEEAFHFETEDEVDTFLLNVRV